MSGRILARGARVHLRSLSQSDRDEFLERVRASRRLHRPWAYPPDSSEAFDAFLRRNRSKANRAMLTCRNEDRAIAGYFRLSQISMGPFESAYLGYYAFSPFERTGAMSEGLRLVLAYAFEQAGLHRVQANIQPGNTRSIALVRRAGFVKEGYARRYLKVGGRWRDHEHWVIFAEDFRRPAGSPRHSVGGRRSPPPAAGPPNG